MESVYVDIAYWNYFLISICYGECKKRTAIVDNKK